jgi:hypothetical protein
MATKHFIPSVMTAASARFIVESNAAMPDDDPLEATT